VAVGVDVDVGVGEGVEVAVGVEVGVSVCVGVAVGVCVGVAVGVDVGVEVAVDVGVAVGSTKLSPGRSVPQDASRPPRVVAETRRSSARRLIGQPSEDGVIEQENR
jgi:hypothetical protein